MILHLLENNNTDTQVMKNIITLIASLLSVFGLVFCVNQVWLYRLMLELSMVLIYAAGKAENRNAMVTVQVLVETGDEENTRQIHKSKLDKY